MLTANPPPTVSGTGPDCDALTASVCDAFDNSCCPACNDISLQWLDCILAQSIHYICPDATCTKTVDTTTVSDDNSSNTTDPSGNMTTTYEDEEPPEMEGNPGQLIPGDDEGEGSDSEGDLTCDVEISEMVVCLLTNCFANECNPEPAGGKNSIPFLRKTVQYKYSNGLSVCLFFRRTARRRHCEL